MDPIFRKHVKVAHSAIVALSTVIVGLLLRIAELAVNLDTAPVHDHLRVLSPLPEHHPVRRRPPKQSQRMPDVTRDSQGKLVKIVCTGIAAANTPT